jgi:hypothetical protein
MLADGDNEVKAIVLDFMTAALSSFNIVQRERQILTRLIEFQDLASVLFDTGTLHNLRSLLIKGDGTLKLGARGVYLAAGCSSLGMFS